MDKQQRMKIIQRVEERLREVYMKRMIIIGAAALIAGLLLGWGAAALGIFPVASREVVAKPSDPSVNINTAVGATNVPAMFLPTYSPAPVLAVPTDIPPAPTAAPEYTTVQNGDKSDAVKDVQARLVELGYLSDTADGVFGNNTAKAVKSFQAAVGLTETGVADNITQTKLFSPDAPKAS